MSPSDHEPSVRSYWQSRWRLLLLAVLQFVGMNVCAHLVFTSRLRQGVYPMDADSIGIPLIGIFIVTMMGLMALLFAVLLPGGHLLLRGIRVLFTVFACMLTCLLGLAGFDEHHWPLSVASALTVVLLVWMAYRMGVSGDKT